MKFLTSRKDITDAAVSQIIGLPDLIKLLKQIKGRDFLSFLPSFIFSIGHLENADPGAVNTSEDKTNEFSDEISANHSAIVTIFKKFHLSSTPFVLQSADTLGNIIRSAISIFGFCRNAILVNVHHDMSLRDDHPSSDDHKFLFYYGSEKGRRVCNYLSAKIKQSIPNAQVVILHHTASPRRRLGFIARTLNVAIIAECGFISQKKSILQRNHDVLSDALLSLHQDIANNIYE